MPINNTLESDLQDYIDLSWELFKAKVGLPDAYLISTEITTDSTAKRRNRMDLLAYDPKDSSLVVIELKRGKDKRQLFQALTYVAEIARWGKEEIIGTIEYYDSENEKEDLINLVKECKGGINVKIILVAEEYSSEVTVTAHWLALNSELKISAFKVTRGDSNNSPFHFKKHPLEKSMEVYKKQIKQQRAFKEAVKKRLEINMSSMDKRKFDGIKRNVDGFKSINLNFNRNYIHVGTRDSFKGDCDLIKSKVTGDIELGEWKYGRTFSVKTKKQFDELANWLELDAAMFKKKKKNK